MNHIGSILRQLREQKGMTRIQLAKDICTEKYLYYIERGERNPSVEITRLLGIRLGADLFSYFEFLDCHEPVMVHNTIMQFNVYRITANFAAAKELSEKVKDMPDFQSPPWKYEIMLNNATFMLYVERRFKESFDYIRFTIADIPAKYAECDFVANLYVTLSACYLEFKDLKKSGKMLEYANKIICNKEDFSRYNTTVITVKLNTMKFCNYLGNYDSTIELGLHINALQLRTNSIGRASYICYYLAHAYYKKGMIKEALDWFEKCLFDLINYPSDITAYFISNYEHFHDMLRHPLTNSILADKIVSQYNLKA